VEAAHHHDTSSRLFLHDSSEPRDEARSVRVLCKVKYQDTISPRGIWRDGGQRVPRRAVSDHRKRIDRDPRWFADLFPSIRLGKHFKSRSRNDTAKARVHLLGRFRHDDSSSRNWTRIKRARGPKQRPVNEVKKFHARCGSETNIPMTSAHVRFTSERRGVWFNPKRGT